MSSPSLSNSRVWFITGTSGGLGKALLEYVLEKNERVVATLRKPEVLSSLQDKYPTSQLLILPLDVQSPSQIVSAFGATKKYFGRLDVVVNNAGHGLFGEIEATSDEAARRQIEVLFWGPVNITKEAIKLFREVNPAGHGGRVLNISSIGGYSANPLLAFYSAGKFALEGFTESFTKEMPPSWNIKGVIVEPGGFGTSWAGSGMEKVPPHPAYADPSTPSSMFRSMLGSVNFIGDPAKAARAMYQIAGEADPPLRIQLGTDALGLARTKATSTLNDAEKWEELSHSTNIDGFDKDIMSKIAVVNK